MIIPIKQLDVTRVQILDETICLSHSIRKDIYFNILLPAMSE